MDASFTLTRLSEEFSTLVESGDLEGAEELLFAALGCNPGMAGFIHYHFGKLYKRWNKLSSAVHHLHHAIDVTVGGGNEMFMIQILEELNSVKNEQRGQRP